LLQRRRKEQSCCAAPGRANWNGGRAVSGSPGKARTAFCDNEFVIERPTYADLLFRVRRAAGLTQRALAQRTEVPQPTIAAIEAGRRDPRVGTLSKLVDGCGWELVMLPRKGLGIDRSRIRKMLDMPPTERVQRVAAKAIRRRQVTARRLRR